MQEFVGIYPTKVGGGGYQQPYSLLTGQYVSRAAEHLSQYYSVFSSKFYVYTTRVVEGFHGGDYVVARNNLERLLQWVGEFWGRL